MSYADAPRLAVGTLPVVASLAIMVINDHFLKHSGLLPGWLTGKLSDFAFLFFAPIILAFACRTRTRAGFLLSYAVPTLLFVSINLWPPASQAFTTVMSAIYPMYLWPDPWDLVALLILPVSWLYLTASFYREQARTQRRPTGRPGASTLRVIIVTVAAVSCIATSQARPPTHRPIYMSWDELRSKSVKVLPPQPIGSRGKLVIAQEHIFISEPGKGVHIIDNREPKAPRQVAFIEIPGNIDIAIDGDLLFADSFVDLLTFKLDLEVGSVELLGRLEDQFNYDPMQVLPADDEIIFDVVYREKGVVVGAIPLSEAGPEADGEWKLKK